MRILLALSAAAILALAFAWHRSSESAPGQEAPAPAAPQPAPRSAATHSIAEASAPEAVAPGAVAPESARTFPARFRAEAESVFLPDSNPAATELRLRRLAGSLRPRQIVWLRQRALEHRAPPAHRYLALYLLAGAPGSLEELVRAAVADDEVFHAPAPAHSGAEARRRFETSLRLKAIDAIPASPAGTREKEDALARVASAAPIVGLREVAADRLARLRGEPRFQEKTR